MQLKIDEIRAEKIIPADDSVRLLGEIMEEMDYTPLLRAYKRTGRRPATNPVTMLKIVVYAIMEGIFSSRAIASACKRDINFIWLLNGENAPNHSEIARFRSKRLTECGEELFYQTIEKLSELGEIKYEHLFVDGTKIEANANKYSQSSARKRKKNFIRLYGAILRLRNILSAFDDFAGNEILSERDFQDFQSVYIDPQTYTLMRSARLMRLQRKP